MGHGQVLPISAVDDRTMDIIMPLCGLHDRDDWPNSCALTRYSPADGVDWQCDDERLFQGMFKNCAVISLSLGALRNFEVRRAHDVNSKKGCAKVVLNSGDVVTMEGLTQKFYQYKVSRE